MADEIERLKTPDITDRTESKKEKKKKTKDARGNRFVRWFREMRAELKKVVWPTPKQILNNTLVALAVICVSAIVLWGVDFGASAIFNAIRTIFAKV